MSAANSGRNSDAAEEVRRYQAAAAALDDVRQVVAMARLEASFRAPGGASPGRIVVGGERVSGARHIGLLAASMNPLTRAHLALAASAREAARLDALCWVATAVTVDKETVERATLADRLLQAEARARAVGEGLLLLRGGLYVEQARAARALIGQATEVTLIVGYDKIVQIFDPRYYADRDAALSELFDEANITVAPRSGHDEADLRALLDLPGNRPFARHVSFCPLPARYQGDSSTEARAALTAGQREVVHALLAPEGRALAETTRAYDPVRMPGADDLGDAYSARQAILAALSDLSEGDLAEVPTLGRLVTLAGEPGVAGVALRAWVADPPQRHTLAMLRAALAAR